MRVQAAFQLTTIRAMRKIRWPSSRHPRRFRLRIRADSRTATSTGPQRAEGHSGGHAKAGAHRRRDRRLSEGGRRRTRTISRRAGSCCARSVSRARTSPAPTTRRRSTPTAKKAGEQALAVVDRALRAKGVNSVKGAREAGRRRARARSPARRGLPLGLGELGRVGARLRQDRRGARRGGRSHQARGDHRACSSIRRSKAAAPPASSAPSRSDAAHPVHHRLGVEQGGGPLLNESLKIDPTNKITRVFLAEAMVADDSNSATRRPFGCCATWSTRRDDPNCAVENAARAGRCEGAPSKMGRVAVHASKAPRHGTARRRSRSTALTYATPVPAIIVTCTVVVSSTRRRATSRCP